MHVCAIGLARLEHSVLEMLVKQNAEIKDELKSIKAMMFQLLQLQKGLEAVRTGRLTTDIQLRLKMISDTAAVEENLASPETYSQVIRNIYMDVHGTAAAFYFDYKISLNLPLRYRRMKLRTDYFGHTCVAVAVGIRCTLMPTALNISSYQGMSHRVCILLSLLMSSMFFL